MIGKNAYQIDHARRLVVARGKGVFADADVFAYQREDWSQPDVAGYDENGQSEQRRLFLLAFLCGGVGTMHEAVARVGRTAIFRKRADP